MRTVKLLAAVAMGIAACTGCSNDRSESPVAPDAPVTHTPAPDETGTELPDLSTRAVLIDETSIELTTYGSSSCPDEVTDVDPVDADTIAVHLDNSMGSQDCTADYAPAQHTFDLPAEITDRPITLQLRWENSAETATIEVEEQ